MSEDVQTLGLPETNSPITQQIQNNTVDSSSKSCFMDLTVANFNTTEILTPPKGSLIYSSTGYPILDFFFYILLDTPDEYLTDRLERAWKYDALSTLKLICNLRGIRGTGKADSKNYYRAALWLQKNHPKTFACNLKSFAEFGSFEDFLVILNKLNEVLEVAPEPRSIVINPFLPKKKSTVAFPKDMIQARIWRQEKNRALRIRALEKLGGDPDYKFLYDKITELYAESLVFDLQFLESGELDKISSASKWCPSLRSSFEHSILFTESTARKVYPHNSCPEYEGVEEARYAKRIRHRLRKEFLVPLRKAL
ncbi:hypothetical protein C5167_018370 [Papaver somniferum]|uniref:DUF2828 domain-containing protein n=1 Tax=Papaver somniferum TaxID=3469 RepID=A0A4Y7IQ65_PAPSO|nr:uncharacterized protein LOC113351330 [Papaver somniferum]RZC49940.1 hypothetical protein C5167_018370 [Papaver somniferum]